MTAPDPWVALTPRADPNVTVGPTIYADDPPGVVAFLTDPPWHQACDAGGWAPGAEAPYPCARCGIDQYDHDDDECRWLPPGTCLDCAGDGCVLCGRSGIATVI